MPTDRADDLPMHILPGGVREDSGVCINMGDHDVPEGCWEVTPRDIKALVGAVWFVDDDQLSSNKKSQYDYYVGHADKFKGNADSFLTKNGAKKNTVVLRVLLAMPMEQLLVGCVAMTLVPTKGERELAKQSLLIILVEIQEVEVEHVVGVIIHTRVLTRMMI